MLIEAGRHYWYVVRSAAYRVTAVNMLKLKRGTAKEEVYVVKSSCCLNDTLSPPMRVVGNGTAVPYIGPNRYNLFNTEREAIAHEAQRLHDQAAQMIGRLDDAEQLDSQKDSTDDDDDEDEVEDDDGT